MNVRRHDIVMVIAGAVPLLLMFILPLLGFTDVGAVVAFLFFLFAGHLFVLHGYSGGKERQHGPYRP